jgi:hypothetical protein
LAVVVVPVIIATLFPMPAMVDLEVVDLAEE